MSADAFILWAHGFRALGALVVVYLIICGISAAVGWFLDRRAARLAKDDRPEVAPVTHIHFTRHRAF